MRISSNSSLISASDFIAMRGVPFVRFSELNATKYCDFVEDDDPDKVNHSHVRVFRRSQTASICGLTESQFVEWCILSGNDFTLSFDIADFDGLEREVIEKDKKGSSKKDDGSFVRVKERCSDAKRIIKGRGEDFRLNALNPKLKMAIEFSRDFYELRDLSKYPIDPPDEEVHLVSLTVGDRAAITRWIESHPRKRKPMSLQDVGLTSCTILKEMLSSSLNDDFPAIDLLENVTPVHLNALERMLRQLHEQRDYHFKHPNWRDIMFTHYYQLICKSLLKQFRRNMDRESTEFHHIFNPELFYTFLEEETLKAAMSNLSIEPTSHPVSKRSPKKKINNNLASRQTNQSPSKSEIQPDAQLKTESTDDLLVEDKPVSQDILPIDAYKEEILYRIDRDRVTIIQGETGCGKSSRIPVMLLEESQRRGVRCRMMVSQPRRIAASSLMKRVRSTLGMQVNIF